MLRQSLAEKLSSLADASATQPRSRLQSPFSPLVSWLATLWASDRKAAKRDHCRIPEPTLFTSPASLHEPPNTLPSVHSTDITGIALHDDDDYDDSASDMRIPLRQSLYLGQSHKDGLTEEEVDYVVNTLLEHLEEAKVASPEPGCEDYEYYAPEYTGRRLRHGLWSPGSSMYVLYGSEDGDGRSEAETLEMDEAYDRASLELARTECYVPELRNGDDGYPYQFESGPEGEVGDSE